MRQKLLSYTLIFALVYGTTPYSFAAGVVIVDNTINGAAANETLVLDASNTFNITEDKGFRAQKLLKTERFNHPSFWAPYLLVGNWL